MTNLIPLQILLILKKEIYLSVLKMRKLTQKHQLKNCPIKLKQPLVGRVTQILKWLQMMKYTVKYKNTRTVQMILFQ